MPKSFLFLSSGASLVNETHAVILFLILITPSSLTLWLPEPNLQLWRYLFPVTEPKTSPFVSGWGIDGGISAHVGGAEKGQVPEWAGAGTGTFCSRFTGGESRRVPSHGAAPHPSGQWSGALLNTAQSGAGRQQRLLGTAVREAGGRGVPRTSARITQQPTRPCAVLTPCPPPGILTASSTFAHSA